MIIKIEDRRYFYQGIDVCSIAATIKVYDTTNVVDSHELLANFNINDDATIVSDTINLQISTQITEYLQKIQQIDALRQQAYPTSNSFNDAINLIFDPIEQSLNI